MNETERERLITLAVHKIWEGEKGRREGVAASTHSCVLALLPFAAPRPLALPLSLTADANRSRDVITWDFTYGTGTRHATPQTAGRCRPFIFALPSPNSLPADFALDIDHENKILFRFEEPEERTGNVNESPGALQWSCEAIGDSLDHSTGSIDGGSSTSDDNSIQWASVLEPPPSVGSRTDTAVGCLVSGVTPVQPTEPHEDEVSMCPQMCVRVRV